MSECKTWPHWPCAHLKEGITLMNRKTLLISVLTIAMVMAPMVFYVTVFGASLSSDHTRWAEFGAAIGGIYSPLVALFALVVLRAQVELQAQMNVHAADQAYLQQAREDIEFYATQMAQLMGTIAVSNKTLREVLHEGFAHLDVADFDSERLRNLAAEVHRLFPATFDLWAAIYSILTGLSTGKAHMYVLTFESSKQKLIAILSFRTSVALDNLHRTLTEGSLKTRYEFSSLLSDKHLSDHVGRPVEAGQVN